MKNTKVWDAVSVDSLTFNHLHGLMLGHHAAVVINDFYNKEWCQVATIAIQNAPLKKEYIQDNVNCWYLGEPLIERKHDRNSYFNDAEKNMSCISDLFSVNGIASPLSMILKLFGEIWPGGALIASENGIEYFAGIIRTIRRSPLHNDNALRDFPDWQISRIRYQLSWNVFLNVPGCGQGATQIWQRKWQPDDEKFKHLSRTMMGYTYEVIKDSSSCILEPAQGQLVIINPHFYHEVRLSDGTPERITMSSFIGANTIMDPLILWS